MTSDELKALRLRRVMIVSELSRIDTLLSMDEYGLAPAEMITLLAASKITVEPKPSAREEFYREAENDFRDSDSNGNYMARRPPTNTSHHDPGDEDPKAWSNSGQA